MITPLAKGLEIIFDNNSLVYFLKQFKYNNTNIDWTGILLLKIIFNNKIKLIENGHEKLFNVNILLPNLCLYFFSFFF